MNPYTHSLVEQSLEAVKNTLNTDLAFCIVADATNEQAKLLHCPVNDYWKDPQGFEKGCATQIDSEFGRGVFLLPVIMANSMQGHFEDFTYRPNDRSPGQGEFEAVFGLAFDLTDGLDVIRLAATRRPGGELVYGDLQVLNTPVELTEELPGYGVFMRLMAKVS